MGLGDIIKGAAGGGMTGFSAGGGNPWAAAAGAGLGGLLSMFGGQDANAKALEDYRKQVMARQAPQIGPASQAATSGFRADQQNLIGRLDALSRGEGPSLAAEQLKQATDRNMQAQQSIAQSGRGNAALANIVAANNMESLGQNSAQQAALARIAEQQMALQQLGGNLQAGRGADEQLGQFNAQQQNYANKDNLEARLRTMGMNDSAILASLGQSAQLANIPGMGDQILAGGAGALGMYASQEAQRRAAAQQAEAAYGRVVPVAGAGGSLRFPLDPGPVQRLAPVRDLAPAKPRSEASGFAVGRRSY